MGQGLAAFAMASGPPSTTYRLTAGRAGAKGGDQRYEGRIDEQDPRAAMVDDVFDLRREQARVHGKQHGAHARHTEIELEVR